MFRRTTSVWSLRVGQISPCRIATCCCRSARAPRHGHLPPTRMIGSRGARGRSSVDVDPAEIEKMNMKVDLKIVADARMFLRELLGQLGSSPRRTPAAWLERVRDWKRRYPVVLPEHHARTDYVSTYAFSQILSEELSEGGGGLPYGLRFRDRDFPALLRGKERTARFPQSRHRSDAGSPLPAAIGACLATEKRRTICVDGDGGFQFNVQELETIRRYDLPIKVFVLNNQGYASIRTSQARYFQRLVGSDPSSGMTLPDTLVVAHAYGIPGMRISGGAMTCSEGARGTGFEGTPCRRRDAST